ncbi:hypothetical protein LTR16_000107 [Cryomyces antarcticus]|uniref:PCI domain-containing protein n=1 Tax=Cryomyces antarcticus TaxID=329879 RepID=A0ABR0M071_9PEZI|nr:hypothetical protein LTR16_000107 [Cryomyces antarcticus]
MAHSLESGAYFSQLKAKGRIVVSGRARLRRLLLIGTICPPLSLEALHLAVTEAKRGKDVEQYLQMVERLNEIDGHDLLGVPDTTWVQKRNALNANETGKLESELKGYKNNLIKESIRMGNEELATHYFNIGALDHAIKAYSAMRDHCNTPKHVSEMYLKLVLVYIAQGNWLSAKSQLDRMRVLNLKLEEKARLDPTIHACSGLTSMCNSQYRDAANEFLQVDPSFMTEGPIANIDVKKAVLTSNDIAVYGGLCALASMYRSELQAQVLDNPLFRQFLELEPHIRRAITFFCASKFTQCLAILDAYRTDYTLDLYLFDRIGDIYARIRAKSIQQYFIPFSCVTLREMEKEFGTRDGQTIEDELIDMIQRGELDARIDVVEKVSPTEPNQCFPPPSPKCPRASADRRPRLQLLVAPLVNTRAALHTQAIAAAKEHEKSLRLRLHRNNMILAGLVLETPKGSTFKGAGGRGVFS